MGGTESLQIDTVGEEEHVRVQLAGSIRQTVGGGDDQIHAGENFVFQSGIGAGSIRKTRGLVTEPVYRVPCRNPIQKR